MTRPNIQIDDEVREMTEEEYAQYLICIQDSAGLYPDVVADVVEVEPIVDDLVEGEQP
jgi:hypothetical protein